jgi:hypothetical protein
MVYGATFGRPPRISQNGFLENSKVFFLNVSKENLNGVFPIFVLTHFLEFSMMSSP